MVISEKQIEQVDGHERASKEIVGPLERYDQRDHINNRITYFPGTPIYEEYYGRHPGLKDRDDKLRAVKAQEGRKREPRAAALGQALFDLRAYFERFVEGEVAPIRVPFRSPEQAAEHVKGVARYLGADLVGITKLNPAWIYTHMGRPIEHYGRVVELNHRYAVVMAVERDYVLFKTAPLDPVQVATGMGYGEEAKVACVLARHIQHMGYEARAHPSANEQVLKIPLAIDAGLGELGRMGLLVTKQLGARLALAVVTTNLEMTIDRPIDIGMQDFCNRCVKCVINCPGGAISKGEKTLVRGVLKWKIRPEACRLIWEKNSASCAICVSVCPWNKPGTLLHKMAREFASGSRLARSFLIRADDLFYGRKFRRGLPPSWLDFGHDGLPDWLDK
ncbi:MAG: 4Fe-4S dicluster domain-containing protein [Chloroflexi bacterium]|nr:4Fe-4S dicluster domain-containing protein [Chloroflexota bacterium]